MTSMHLTDEMYKPQLDDRSYRVIELPNKLQALLIHDPETDKASAALDVAAGSASDPKDMYGLAHAVEHLLFMGTEKYPLESEYGEYLQKHGGYSNAYTALGNTNYHFEVSLPASADLAEKGVDKDADLSKTILYQALDRFSQFFVNPLFLEDTVDRELQAVDSEHKKNMQSDLWRKQRLNRLLSNPQHPSNTFSTGSFQTLHDEPIARGEKIRERFMEFYRKEYSANRMKLVVLGREQLDTLEKWVVEMFSAVTNKDLPRSRYDDIPLYTHAELGKQIFVKPVMDTRSLDLIFPYPDQTDLWEAHPERYLSHMIGHEGSGSLCAYLKSKGWITGLSAGDEQVVPGSATMTVAVTMTEDGLKNYKDIIKICFQYIALLKAQTPQEWVGIEMQKLSELEFRFRQKYEAISTTSGLANVMQEVYPRDKLLSAQTVLTKFDPQAIKKGLDCLRPDNFKFMIFAPDFPGDWDKTERYYGVQYKVEDISADFLQEIQAAYDGPKLDELHLPGKNEFVPDNVDVEKKKVEKAAVVPKLIRNDARVRVWWKKDDQFWAPTAYAHLLFRTPIVSLSATTNVLLILSQQLVEDSLSEYSYDADLAGLSYDLDRAPSGLKVTLGGYNDKMHVLLEKLLSTVRDLDVKEDRFKVIKEKLIRAYKNYEYKAPYLQRMSYTSLMLGDEDFVPEERLEELNSITAEDVRKFLPQLFAQMHVELLFSGNLYREDALKMADLVEGTFKTRALPVSQWPVRRNVIIPPGSNFVYNKVLKDEQNVNHCIDYAVITNMAKDRETRTKLALFDQMTDEMTMNRLRTKEQLGYIVASRSFTMSTVSGWRVIIQSERTPEYLEERIEACIESMGKVFHNMSDADFETNKNSLIQRRLEKLKNLGEESTRLWTRIQSERYDFELETLDVEHIRKITKDDIIEFYNTYIHPDSANRAKISLHMIAKGKAPAKTGNKRERATDTLSSLLGQLQIDSDKSKIAARMAKIEIEDVNAETAGKALKGHLIEDVGVPESDAEQLVGALSAGLEQALSSPDAAPKEEAEKDNQVSIVANDQTQTGKKERKSPVIIENLHEFVKSMQLTEGPEPIKDLSSFEDIDAKL